LLGQIDNRVASVSADGAYDTEGVYEAAHAHGEGRTVRVLIPPGRGARLSPRPSDALKERNRNIRSIRRLGRREWQDHHRPRYEESHPGEPTGGGATRMQGSQHNDPSRDARQLPSGVILSRGTGPALSSEPCNKALHRCRTCRQIP
jgi:hypothetical protein